MSDQFDNCTAVTPACPVEGTTYGYTPNLAGNVLLLALFGLAALAHGGLGVFYRLWSFGTVVTISCIMEAVGYIGRVMMHNNPWDDTAFKIQVVCLIVAPSFLAAGIYLSVKHIVMAISPELSRLPPKFYTWIFISADALSILMQAAGGGIAAASDDASLLKTGNKLMIAGIGIQVGTMALCVMLAVDFGIRVWRNKKSTGARGSLGQYNTTKGFYYYLIASGFAFLFIFIRCIYRLPEMYGGWGNELMRHEDEFLVLDGAMIVLASIIMAAAHPGIFFPAMRTQGKKVKHSPSSSVSYTKSEVDHDSL